jgi:hypothetical protein
MRKRIPLLFVVVTLGLLLVPPVWAATLLYDNGSFTSTNGGWAISHTNWTSDSFTLSSAATLTEVQAVILTYPNGNPPLTVYASVGTTYDDSTYGYLSEDLT